MDKQVEIEKEVFEQGVGVDISYDGNVTFQSLARENPFQGGAIQRLITARNTARAAKNFAESDRIRSELLAKDIVLEDKPDGTTTWRKVKR
jgi:cysteinyl-tRNA synthetase